MTHCPIVYNVKDIIGRVQLQNRIWRHKSIQEGKTYKPTGMIEYDFKAAYPSVFRPDFYVMFEKIITFLWKFLPGCHGFILVDLLGKTAWSDSAPSQNNNVYTYTPAKLMKHINYLMEHSFLRFAGDFYLCSSGIPMGAAPSVFFCNLYLFAWEVDWVATLNNWLHTTSHSHRAKCLPVCF